MSQLENGGYASKLQKVKVNALEDTKTELAIDKVITGKVNELSQSELEKVLHSSRFGQGEGNQTIISIIQTELEKRQKNKETRTAEKAVFWQKWGVLLSVVLSIIALIISWLAYIKA